MAVLHRWSTLRACTDSILLSTLQASDVTIDGIHEIAVAQGAIHDLQGTAVEAMVGHHDKMILRFGFETIDRSRNQTPKSF